MYKGEKVYDIHGHVTAPDAARGFVTLLLGSNTAMPSPLQRSAEQRAGSELSDEAFQKAATRHAKYMDDRNIDVQVIGPRPFIVLGWMQPHLLPAWCRFFNDCIKKQCDYYPDRFIGAATLPQISGADDLSNCIPEMDRCTKELGFKAIYLSPDPAGSRTTPGMHEPYWFPIYEKCEREQIPIIVHGTNATDRRYSVVPHNYQLGFATEQYLATQFLGHGDVFQRYPGLKILICHCGGALNRFIKTDPHLPQKDLSKNLFYDTCVYDLDVLEAGIKQRGVSQIIFGTEAPGSGQAVRPETGKTSDDLIPHIDSFGFLSDKEKMDIMHNNGLSFLPAFGQVGAPVAAG
jgi:predicted TIM-barrel fold metal-dependent hydrolase